MSSSTTFPPSRSARRRLRVQHAGDRRVGGPTDPRAKPDARTDRSFVRDGHAAGDPRPQCRDRTIQLGPPLEFAELPSGGQSPADSRQSGAGGLETHVCAARPAPSRHRIPLETAQVGGRSTLQMSEPAAVDAHRQPTCAGCILRRCSHLTPPEQIMPWGILSA